MGAILGIFAFCLAVAAQQSPAEDADAATEPTRGIPSQGPLDEGVELFEPREPLTVEDRRRIDANAWYLTGRLHETRREWQEALAAYQQALEYDPDAVAVYRRIVPLGFRLGRFEEALRYAMRAVELDPASYPLLIELGNFYEGQGDSRRALLLYEQAADSQAIERASIEYVQLMDRLGRLYAQEERFTNAAESYAVVVAALDDPESYGTNAAELNTMLQDPAGAYERFGQAFLEADRFDEALAAFQKAQELAPNQGRLAYNLAQVYFEQEQGELALEQVRHYLDRQLQTQGTGPYELLARILEELGRSGELLGMLEDAAERDANNATLGYFLAEQYVEADRIEDARDLYVRLLAIAPEPHGYRGLATVYRRLNEPAALIEALSDGYEEAGDLSALEAEISAIAGEAELVDQVLQAARGRNGEDDLGYAAAYVVAHIASEGERPDDAMEFYRVALDERPDQALLLYQEMTQELVAAERYSDAVELLEGAIEERVAPPGNPLLHYYLAIALELDGQTDAALEAADEAIDMAPDVGLLHSRRAWVLFHAGRYEEARDAYEAIIEQFPMQPGPQQDEGRTAHYMLSSTYQRLGAMEQAEAVLQRVLELDPNDATANNDLGYLWADQGRNLDEAQRMIGLALEQEPDNAAYLDSMGWVLYQKGEYEEALGYLQRAAEDPAGQDGVIYDHLGDVHQQLGNHEQAREAWQRALEFFSDEPQPDQERIEALREKLRLLEEGGAIPRPGSGERP